MISTEATPATLRGGVERTQVDVCPKVKKSLEQTLLPSATSAAEISSSVAYDVARENPASRNERIDLERGVLRGVDLEIVPGHAIRLDLASELRFESLVRGSPSKRSP